MLTANGRLSPSALDRYRACPRQFQLRDIEGVPTYEPASEVLVVGQAVHEALSLFHRLRPVERSEESIAKCLRSVWTKHTAGVFPSVELERSVGERWLAHLSEYATGSEAAVTPLGFERWAETTLDGVVLFGRIDRVDRLSDGRLRVVDYKTGRCRLDEEDLPKDSAALVYALAAQTSFGAPTGAVSFLYLAEGIERRWDLEEFDIDEAQHRLRGHLSTIVEDESFEPVPGEACRFCPVRDHCPDADRLDLEAIRVPGDCVF